MEFLGNKDLLQKRKVGFLASRKIPTLSVLPTLDWAMAISAKSDIAVVSGFQSRLEKEVLNILLKGKCGIILILARGMYRKLPQQFEQVMEEQRLLILSYENPNVTRVSEVTAHKRNERVRELSDSLKEVR